MLVKISDVKIGNRFRQDLGEIGPLVDSIKRHGLLHPIVITDKNELICGRRRIEAFAKLGRKEIEANNIDLHDSNLSECEADENIVRKNFTVYEIAQIDQFYREKEEAAALMRQKNGKASENFAKGRSSAKIAPRVGVSDRTLEKIRTIQDVCTKAKDPQLAEIWKKVGEGKLKVNKGYRSSQEISTN